MELLRPSEAEVGGAGGPAAGAMRLGELVPAGDSVAAEVAEILHSVRAGGDQALAELTRRYDTGGADPRPLLVEPEALDEAIREMPLELVAGLQVGIANLPPVAEAAAGGDS